MLKKQKKEIYFVLGSFKVGGTEKVAARVGAELIERGYNVKFILLKSIYDYNEEVLLKNSYSLCSEKHRSKFSKAFFSYTRLMLLLLKNRPSLLISFSLGINTFIFLTFYPKIFFTVETNIFAFIGRLHRRYLQKYLSVFPNVKRVIVPSYELQKACSKYLIKSDKLRVISNPVDISKAVYQSKRAVAGYEHFQKLDYFIFSGRLNGMKGIKQVIEVYSSSKLIKQGIHFVIMGEGNMRSELEETVKKLNVQEYVHLIGFQSNPYYFYSNAKFLILNSRFESFGNVIIEAFACGIPVISNDCDFGPRELIKHGHNGLLFKKEVPNELLHSIERPFSEYGLLEKLSKASRETAEKYDISCVVDTWESVIKEVI